MVLWAKGSFVIDIVLFSDKSFEGFLALKNGKLFVTERSNLTN
jgi:hypothetical protein